MAPEPRPALPKSKLVDLLFRLEELADYVVPFSIRAVCQVGIPDLLAEGSRPVAELAELAGVHAGTLRRVLRVLAGKGIVTELPPGCFGLAELGQLLRSDHPLSHGDIYPMLRADIEAWAAFEYTLFTGEPAFEHVHGERYYDWLAGHRTESLRFDRSVRGQNRLVARTLLAGYDWAGCGIIVDVGGGDGTFLASLLARYRAVRGVVFDLPHVVAGAPEVLRQARVADRCEVIGGSFFSEVPAEGNVYLLKTILHDWDDERATALLRTVGAAMRPDSRLLVLEALDPPDNAGHVGRLMDLNSLVLVQGPDRDEAAFRSLLAGAGLSVQRVLPTPTLGIIECVVTEGVVADDRV